MQPTQANRPVTVTSALGADVLLFRRMQCSEALGQLFEFRVQLESSRADIATADVLGQPLTVTLDLEEGGERHFHGIVTRFAYLGWRDGMPAWEAIVHPALWLLTRSSDCRIFQDKTALEIVKAVCGDGCYGGLIKIDAGKLSSTPAKREFCVQYRESDFDFVSRLLEEEGIYYYFRHEAGAHTMVLADGYGAHASAAGYATLPFWDEQEGRRAPGKAVSRMWPAGAVQSGEYALNDYDFEQPAAIRNAGLLVKSAIAAPYTAQRFRQYDYPGRYKAAGAGESRARARMEALHGQGEQVDGATNARGIGAGALFKLAEHPRADQNREFLVTATAIEFASSAYGSGGTQGAFEFQCSFQAVGKEHSYRPPRSAARPFVHGPQTAIVVGKAGEETWTDKHGRIKVQFHWERERHDDDTSSCWVRVQQGWAGKGWGTMFIPRIGMEVVVSFLEGDPDQPLVTGCVYNADTVVPYDLPAHQTRSTIKTNSSKGGGGYNELRFEDKKGAEELYIQAEKDCNRVVKNNDTLKVGFEKKDKGDQTIAICHDQSIDVGNDRKVHVVNDETVTVDANQKLDVGKDRSVHVVNDETVKVDANQKIEVGKDRSVQVGKDETVKVDANQKVDVGKTIVIEAGTSIELKVGGSSVKIEPAKITLKSAQIAIEADGVISIKAGGVLTAEGALVKIN
ncbi:type VI secretion system Vgr family protein [Pseudoduganella chitinolytica]|uniref:Type VI secretion system tip protein TssI/VgrG n=1 Tax=Pseudoduganella chitinolytica TaxID=34070 RepID=A0ABY8BFR1_9BURK|nr:type VI secretion system tip protein VgrG [Pseudoduganella chitinolytica]WEF34223.1 type VI secretion system tip protein TssI/VgrG [Pseudoduganella chitinolytica]